MNAPTTPNARPAPRPRTDFRHFSSITTRWADNDAYGHVNNVVYYSYFDTLLNRYLIDAGKLDIHEGRVIGVAVETLCRFHKSFAYPETIDGGLRIGRLGASSVRYEIGLFAQGEDMARAEGHFIHVFVDRTTQRPQPIPAGIREALEKILVVSPS